MNPRCTIPFSLLFLLFFCIPLHAGTSFRPDTLKTAQILLKLQEDADGGDAQAQYELACLYEEGNGQEQDQEMAFYWYKKAAEGGSIPAANKLSWIYSTGTKQVVTRDYVEAEKWCRIAAEAGNPSAQNRMGVFYELGQGGLEQDYPEAFKWYTIATENGSAIAMANLGNMYLNGRAVEKDYSIARQWIEKAVNLGDAYACSRMGRIYEYGYGIDPDYVEAFNWYMKGAEKGDSNSQHAIAYLLRNGKGCEKDLAASAEWYRKAIENGQENDWYSLGAVLYDLEQYEEAVRCFEKAYLSKYSGAATFLGYCYENGRGVGTDLYKAKKLYEEDAEAGYADGYYYLGKLCEKSNFMSVSSVKEGKKAFKMIKEIYEKGAKAGSTKAKNRLKSFESEGFTLRFYDNKGRYVTYYKGPKGVYLNYDTSSQSISRLLF